jgi:hypothetical protein
MLIYKTHIKLFVLNLREQSFHVAGDKIEKNEMDGAYSAYGGGERCVQGFDGKTCVKEATGKTQA